QVLERINDNAYNLDLPSHYGNVSATFNIADLSLYDAGDSRTNPLEEGGNDGDQVVTAPKGSTKSRDPLQDIGGLMTRARTKQMNEALYRVMEKIYEKEIIQQDSNNHTKLFNVLEASLE